MLSMTPAWKGAWHIYLLPLATGSMLWWGLQCKAWRQQKEGQSSQQHILLFHHHQPQQRNQTLYGNPQMPPGGAAWVDETVLEVALPLAQWRAQMILSSPKSTLACQSGKDKAGHCATCLCLAAASSPPSPLLARPAMGTQGGAIGKAWAHQDTLMAYLPLSTDLWRASYLATGHWGSKLADPGSWVTLKQCLCQSLQAVFQWSIDLRGQNLGKVAQELL